MIMIFIYFDRWYDSTFRLQNLINKKIIPIYISYKHLDNSKDKKYKKKIIKKN